MNAITIGLDIAKSVFQVHGEDASGKVVLQKRLRRAQVEPFFAKLAPAVVGIEACGSAHYWGRRLQALGHEVRLIPAAYVQPFVKRNKTDARDAEAICVAVRRPDMRFVPIKSIEQQAARALEGSRELLVKQQTQLINSVRGRLGEYGIVAAQGRRGFAALVARIEAEDPEIPAAALVALRPLLEQARSLAEAIAELEAKIVQAAKADATMRLLATIPGIGYLTAHAIVAAVGAGKQFASARDFAAWVGLTPREHSSGGKRRSGGISRQGDTRLHAVRARRGHAHAQRPNAQRPGHGLAARPPRPPADEGGGHRPGRENRPHRLRDPDLRGALPGAQGRSGMSHTCG